MVGQDANGDRFERVMIVDRSIDAPQTIDFLDEQITRPVGEGDREKENAALGIDATIFWHSCSYRGWRWWARFALPTLRVGRPIKSRPSPEDRRPDPDMRGPKLDRNSKIGAHAHRQVFQAVARGDFCCQREMRGGGVVDR